jgi:HK97 family phage major capsid protein
MKRTVKVVRDEIGDKIKQRTALAEINENGKALTPEQESEFDTLQDEITALRKEEKRLLVLEETRDFSPVTGETGNRDISEKDKKDIASYQISNAIRAKLNPFSANALNGIELEMHQEAEKEARSFGQTITGVGIPSIVAQKRDNSITQGTQGADGANLIQNTKILSLDDMLRNALVMNQLGARYQDGLTVGNDYVRKSARPTATWKDEVTELAKSNVTYSTVSTAPKRLGTYTVHTKQFLMQTRPEVEADIRQELAYSLGEAIDYAALIGGGTNEPTGVYSMAGTSSVILAGATNAGTTGAALTRSDLISAFTKVEAANVAGRNLGWAFNSLTKGKLMDTKVDAGSGKFIMENPNELLGYKVAITNAILNNYAKSTGAAENTFAIFGAWENVYIERYGGFDLTVDTVTLAEYGKVRLIIQAFADVLVYEPKAFSIIKWIKNN